MRATEFGKSPPSDLLNQSKTLLPQKECTCGGSVFLTLSVKLVIFASIRPFSKENLGKWRRKIKRAIEKHKYI